ncbi:MAG: PAS domain S-box protein [Paludibacter sp.]|nr:PAS domain S-box protein [Paludibacter sp.]
MGGTIVIGLIQNIAILLTFSMLYDLFWERNHSSGSLLLKFAAGFALGGIGIVLILSPWTFQDGIIFDTRSVLLCIAGLFFGTIPTVIAMLVVGLYRFTLGGSGVWMGIAVIFSSGTIGVLWHYFRPCWQTKNNILELLGMGVLTHLVMLACTLFLPKQIQWDTLRNIVVPALFIYPVATVLLGKLMIRQHENWKNKKALDISEERWHFALDGAGDGVWDWNPVTNIIYFSKQWKMMLGYDEDEIEDKFEEWETRLFADDRERVFAHLKKFVSGEMLIYEEEHRMLCKDGTYKWILSRGKTVSRNQEGIATRCIGTHKDISDSKNKELELAYERYLLNALMDYSPESIYFKDLDSKFIRVNNFTAKVLGFGNASEVIGKSDFDFFEKGYATKTFNDEQQIIKTGSPIIEEEQGEWLDGRITWGLSNKMPLRNPEGETVGTFGISINITERKLAEQALKESEQYTSSILSVIPDLIFVLSAEGVFLDFKSGNSADLSMPVEEFINRSIFDVMPKSISNKVKSAIDSVMKDGNSNSIDYKLKLNGKMNSFECVIVPFGASRVIAMIRNITVRKQVEEALRTSQEQLKNFAAHLQDVREEERVLLAREIHDELGQILIALKIDLGMLKQTVVRKALDADKESTLRQFEQVFGLLDKTIKTTRKIMTGLRPEVLEMIGFSEAVRLHILEFEARHHLKCTFKNSTSDIQLSSQQSLALFRILQEALTNVAKHAEATLVTVNLSLQDGKITMMIEDNGKGMDENQKVKLDSYGLIGMRERVFLLNGELSHTSKPGEGTSVLVEIPYLE